MPVVRPGTRPGGCAERLGRTVRRVRGYRGPGRPGTSSTGRGHPGTCRGCRLIRRAGGGPPLPAAASRCRTRSAWRVDPRAGCLSMIAADQPPCPVFTTFGASRTGSLRPWADPVACQRDRGHEKREHDGRKACNKCGAKHGNARHRAPPRRSMQPGVDRLGLAGDRWHARLAACGSQVLLNISPADRALR